MEQLPSLAAPGQPVSLGPRKIDSSWHCLTTERTAMVQVGSGPLGLLLTGRLTSWHLAQGVGSHSCGANPAVWPEERTRVQTQPGLVGLRRAEMSRERILFLACSSVGGVIHFCFTQGGLAPGRPLFSQVCCCPAAYSLDLTCKVDPKRKLPLVEHERRWGMTGMTGASMWVVPSCLHAPVPSRPDAPSFLLMFPRGCVHVEGLQPPPRLGN